MRDLTDPRWILFKGTLFVLLGLLSAAALLLAAPTLRVGLVSQELEAVREGLVKGTEEPGMES